MLRYTSLVTVWEALWLFWLPQMLKKLSDLFLKSLLSGNQELETVSSPIGILANLPMRESFIMEIWSLTYLPKPMASCTAECRFGMTRPCKHTRHAKAIRQGAQILCLPLLSTLETTQWISILPLRLDQTGFNDSIASSPLWATSRSNQRRARIYGLIRNDFYSSSINNLPLFHQIYINFFKVRFY